MGKGQFVLCFTSHHPRKWGQELEEGSRVKTMEEYFFLTHFFCLLSLLSYIATPTWLGMVPSTVFWALPYQSLMKMCHRLCLQANLMEAMSHLQLCLHRYVKGLYRVERSQPALLSGCLWAFPRHYFRYIAGIAHGPWTVDALTCAFESVPVSLFVVPGSLLTHKSSMDGADYF